MAGYYLPSYQTRPGASDVNTEGGLVGAHTVRDSQRYQTSIPAPNNGAASADFDMPIAINSRTRRALQSKLSLNVICSMDLAKNYVQTWQMKELAVSCVLGFAFYLFGPINFSFLLAGVSALIAAVHYSYLTSGTLSIWGTIVKFLKILASWVAVLLFTGLIDYIAYRQLGYSENYWTLHYIGISLFIVCGVVLFGLYAFLAFKYFKNVTKISEAIEAGFEAMAKVLTKKD